MKKVATLIALVIFMIGSGYAVNVKPGDTATMQNGDVIFNPSEYNVEIGDYTDFGQIHISSGDSLLMHGVWVKNYMPSSVSMQVQLYSFLKIFQETVNLNKDRFANVNRINPGDSVILYPRYVGGPNEVWVADSAVTNGYNDCIWHITKRYHAGTLQTAPVIIELIPAAIVEQSDADNFWTALGALSWWAWLLLLFGAAILLYLILNSAIKARREEVAEFNFNRNPDNFPPMLQGGLSDNPQEAMRQIGVISNTPENNLISAEEHIVLLRPGFPIRNIMMTFPAGDQEMPLTPGDRYYIATTRLAENSTEEDAYRSHCGNRVGSIISSGHLSLQKDENGNLIWPEGYYTQKISEYRPEEANNASTAADNSDTAAAAPAIENGNGTPPPVKSDLELILHTPQNNVEGIEYICPKFTVTINYRDPKTEA